MSSLDLAIAPNYRLCSTEPANFVEMRAPSGVFNPSDLALLGRVFDHKTLKANLRNLREAFASRIVQEARIAEMSCLAAG
ncbi:hypothetical protein DBIPINDM_007276 (plasmid) [Mesorhizobium sp. AR02]|uniref:hypothetical protein n=1 Tax=Mesorhizobium sp. AR02 TaxID=2865837 RepID=UPI00215DE6B6|nr:hypothetical protein [Mesorhizobium sp. AR02]UVK50026.1 hypothetical protein DBIPINDM_007276 [Mesorhizobium sp. AR02]